jgi:anti-anti-sigma regulatory factor
MAMDVLRITRVKVFNGTLLRVEGSVAGRHGDELQAICAEEAPPLALDLGGVRFIDDAGSALLRRLIACGVQVVDRSHYVAALLGEQP